MEGLDSSREERDVGVPRGPGVRPTKSMQDPAYGKTMWHWPLARISQCAPTGRTEKSGLVPQSLLKYIRRNIPCVKLLPIAGMKFVSRIVFQFPRRHAVIFHTAIGQGQDGLRINGVEIAILDPAVSDHYIIALPAGGRSVRRRKAETHF